MTDPETNRFDLSKLPAKPVQASTPVISEEVKRQIEKAKQDDYRLAPAMDSVTTADTTVDTTADTTVLEGQNYRVKGVGKVVGVNLKAKF